MPGFRWHWTDMQGAGIKIFRVYHYDGGQPFAYFTGGNAGPIYVFDWGQSAYGFRHIQALRCDPQQTNYYCVEPYTHNAQLTGEPSFTASMGDGQWHRLNWRLKMNSTPGARDGVLQFWLDGVQQYSREDLQWMGEESPGSLGWNLIGIGGNAYNSYAPEEEGQEQWYAIDDIVVSTEPLSFDNSPPPTITTILGR